MLAIGDHFAGIARDYDRLRALDPSTLEAWVDAILRVASVGRGGRVLDVGAGTGRLAYPIARRGFRVVALEPSAEMLREARSKGSAVALVRGDALRMPFPDASFDLALISFMLQFIQDRTVALKEAIRVAGAVVVATAVLEGLEDDILSEAFPSFATIDRRRFPTVEAVSSQLRDLGLEVALELVTLERRWAVGDFLEAIRGRYISTLGLLPPGELEAGLRFLGEQLPRRHPGASFTRRSTVAIIGGLPRRRKGGNGSRSSNPSP